jgi:hypothetical protein
LTEGRRNVALIVSLDSFTVSEQYTTEQVNTSTASKYLEVTLEAKALQRIGKTEGMTGLTR